MNKVYDVIIAGGGPAGLSAALVLGRCLRKVLICDTGQYRNASSDASWGFFTRDGTPPHELIRLGREQLKPYDVDFLPLRITTARQTDNNYFEAETEDGNKYTSRRFLIATGVKDFLPEVKGIENYYGKSVHHCPYCDGWQVRHQPLVAYGKGRVAVGLALSLKTWSPDVTLVTDGKNTLEPDDMEKLERNEVKIKCEQIRRLEGTIPKLDAIHFSDGMSIPCKAIFFNLSFLQQSDLSKQLGCEYSDKGMIKTDGHQQTSVEGVFAAGDVDHDLQQVVVAAAEGTKAAININKSLQEEDRK
jgi:thioredoxin reductase